MQRKLDLEDALVGISQKVKVIAVHIQCAEAAKEVLPGLKGDIDPWIATLASMKDELEKELEMNGVTDTLDHVQDTSM